MGGATARASGATNGLGCVLQPGRRQRLVVASRFAGTLMADWLVANFTIFGVHAQNWMVIALAIILIWIVMARRSNR
jgi:hypothetical protein